MVLAVAVAVAAAAAVTAAYPPAPAEQRALDRPETLMVELEISRGLSAPAAAAALGPALEAPAFEVVGLVEVGRPLLGPLVALATAW